MASMLSSLGKPSFVVGNKKYKTKKLIGEGAFGYVYHVHEAFLQLGATSHSQSQSQSQSRSQIEREKDFALKRMICQLPAQVREAEKEIEIMTRITHPNVLSLLASEHMRNRQGHEEYLLLLPLMKTSLQDVIDRRSMTITSTSASASAFRAKETEKSDGACAFADARTVRRLLLEIASALRAVHSAGYRHADLKPANILLSVTNTAFLTDFGSAVPLEEVVSSRAQALQVQDYATTHSTASYRAPELFDTATNCTIDGRSDVWSFGVLMYALLFGRTPFEHPVEGLSTLALKSGKVIFPMSAQWPDDWTAMIRRCLSVDQAERPSIDQLVRGIETLTLSSEVKIATVTSAAASAHPSESPSPSLSANAHFAVAPVDPNTHGVGLEKQTEAEEFANFANFSAEPQPVTAETEIVAPVEDVFAHNVDGDDDFFDDDFAEFQMATPAPPVNISAVPSSADDRHMASTISDSAQLPVLNVYRMILSESSNKQSPLRSANVFVMRLSGFPKTLTRKSVLMQLTLSGIIIRKDNNGTDGSKVHHVLTFHRPFGITASDSLAVGLNGISLCGSEPLDLDDKASAEAHWHSIRVQTANGAVDKRSKFQPCTVEVAFANRDDMNDWIDAIMSQYENYSMI